MAKQATKKWQSNLKAKSTGLINILHCIYIISSVIQAGEISKSEGAQTGKETHSLTQMELVTLFILALYFE